MPQILTNKSNLPQTLVDACKYDTHRTAGDISVTTLIDAPQIRILKKQNHYEVDVMENLYMLMGTALHHILERANIEDERKKAFILTAETIMKQAEAQKAINNAAGADELQRAANYIFRLIPVFFPETEQRFIYEKTMVLEFNGMTISGTFDLYDKIEKRLYDYKFTSTYSYIYPESRIKWKQQTNIYAYMLENDGYEVKDIRVVAFFRDWSKYSMNQSDDYPTSQVLEIPIPLGNPADPTPWKLQVAEYIAERVDLHKKAETGDIPECDGEERWARADGWAVKNPKGKKALRVFNGKTAQAQAQDFMVEAQPKYNEKLFLEYRPGESVKCKEFCFVAKFCGQRKRELEMKAALGI